MKPWGCLDDGQGGVEVLTGVETSHFGLGQGDEMSESGFITRGLLS
jgi:hypothetical protein